MAGSEDESPELDGVAGQEVAEEDVGACHWGGIWGRLGECFAEGSGTKYAAELENLQICSTATSLCMRASYVKRGPSIV